MTEQKKIALVTGATRGIGQAIAIALAQQGMIVAGTATSQEGADIITKHFKDNGLEGQGFVMNVADDESVEKTFEAIKETYGEPLVLVNNAGITKDNIMLRMKHDEWHDVINTNLNSVYRVVKPCLRAMVKNRWGRIINISSVAGYMGNVGQANYAAAKAGMVGFSKSLAQEIASRGITVNVIAPGIIETDMTKDMNAEHRERLMELIPARRAGHVSEIASAVVYLASEGAAYVTGNTIHVNGGMYM